MIDPMVRYGNGRAIGLIYTECLFAEYFHSFSFAYPEHKIFVDVFFT